jgi:hypothetical protein
MVGVSLDGMYHHGANILSGEPADRITYMMNTRFSPVDGLDWNGLFFTHDALRNISEIATDPARSDALPIDQVIAQGQYIPKPLIRLSAHLAEGFGANVIRAWSCWPDRTSYP